MARIPFPPAGFDDLTPDEQRDYVAALWDYLDGSVGLPPVPDWHLAIICERLAKDHASNDPGIPWREALDRIESGLRTRESGRSQ